MSGGIQGAGGIGGLLARTPYGGASAFYHADGNGNVTAMINTSQSLVAQYDYDGFGRLNSFRGSLVADNLYRFSSKEAHLETGLLYYLYRYYDPEVQRWTNRDPIQERGGRNLYQFARNSPVNFIDKLGLKSVPTGVKHCRDKDYVSHHWSEYDGGSIGFWPGDENLVWGSVPIICNSLQLVFLNGRF